MTSKVTVTLYGDYSGGRNNRIAITDISGIMLVIRACPPNTKSYEGELLAVETQVKLVADYNRQGTRRQNDKSVACLVAMTDDAGIYECTSPGSKEKIEKLKKKSQAADFSLIIGWVPSEINPAHHFTRERGAAANNTSKAAARLNLCKSINA